MLVFFDDILVYSKTEDLHYSHLRQVLNLLRQNTLYAKASKCSFGKHHVEYLGHVVTPEVMLDDLPSSFRPFTFEYGRITDPWEHVCRFENTAQLHRISDGVKCCIFATTLTCAAQQWFVQLSGGSIPTFGRLCPIFLHHFANSRKHKKARLRSSALRNMRVSR